MFKSISVSAIPASTFSVLASTGLIVEKWFTFNLFNYGREPVSVKLTKRLPNEADADAVDVPFRERPSESDSIIHRILPDASLMISGPPAIGYVWSVVAKSSALNPGPVLCRISINASNPQSATADTRTADEIALSELLVDSAEVVWNTFASPLGWSDGDSLVELENGVTATSLANMVALADSSDLTVTGTKAVYLNGLLLATTVAYDATLDLPDTEMLAVVRCTVLDQSEGVLFQASDITVEAVTGGYRAIQGEATVAAIEISPSPGDLVSLAIVGATCTLQCGDVSDSGACTELEAGPQSITLGGGDLSALVSGVFVGHDTSVLDFISSRL